MIHYENHKEGDNSSIILSLAWVTPFQQIHSYQKIQSQWRFWHIYIKIGTINLATHVISSLHDKVKSASCIISSAIVWQKNINGPSVFKS